MLARIYHRPRTEIWEHLWAPMNKFRRGEISENTLWKEFSQSINCPIHKECKQVFNQQLDTYASLYKSMISFVRKLQKMWYICIILSDDNSSSVAKIREKWRYDIFVDILVSCEIGLSKYDERLQGTTKIFTYATKKYKAHPKDVLFVDDTAENCVVAEKLGIKTVVAQGPRQTIRTIKKLLNV